MQGVNDDDDEELKINLDLQIFKSEKSKSKERSCSKPGKEIKPKHVKTFIRNRTQHAIVNHF